MLPSAVADESETGLAGPASPHSEKPSSAAATRRGSVETL